MKTKIKLFSKFFLLLSLIILSSCEKDLYDEQIKQNELNVNAKEKTISFETFKNKVGLNKINDKIRSKFKSNQQLFDPMSKEADGFTIDTTKVIYTTNGDKETYTMKVVKQGLESDKFANVVFIPKVDHIDTFIMEYKKRAEGGYESITKYNSNYELIKEVTIDSQIYQNINSTAGRWYLVETTCPCEGHYYFDTHCTCSQHGNLFMIWYDDASGSVTIFPVPEATPDTSIPTPAPSTGTTPTNPTNPTSPNSGTSGGNQTETPSQNFELELFPISIHNFDMDNVCIASFLGGLSPDQNDWLNHPDNVLFNNIIYNMLGNQADCEANNSKASQIINLIMSNSVLKGELRAYFMQTGDMNAIIEFIEEAINGSLIDFENDIIIDPTFINSKTECIYNRLKANPDNSFSKLLSLFKDDTNKELTFKIGNPSNGDWGITDGTQNHPNKYIITISSIVENSSNLSKTITLYHELIHAYIFSTLESNGLLYFDANSNPILDIYCNNSTNYNTINLNTLSTKDRFEALLCAMNQNTPLSNLDWSHSLYNTTIFNVESFRITLENYLTNSYPWYQESQNFQNAAQQTFGDNWKQDISKAISWIGLESTTEYNNYLNSYLNSPSKYYFISNIRNIILQAKNTCP